VNYLVGLFSKTPKDPQEKKNLAKYKELKKLVKAKKYPEALRIGRDVLNNMPHHHDALFIVGGIYYIQNKFKTAITYFDKSLEIGQYDIDVLLLKAYSHQKLNENKRVLQCCDKIKEIDPKNKPVSELLESLDL
jgi:tetratricopeptide (TPR) repeat protein